MNYKTLDLIFTSEKFPAEECIIKSTNTRDKGVYYSEHIYLCLVIDKRFPDSRAIKLMKPYIWIGDESEEECFKGETGYGWTCPSENNALYDNFENPVNGYTWDEFVIGWTIYKQENDEEYLKTLVEKLRK